MRMKKVSFLQLNSSNDANTMAPDVYINFFIMITFHVRNVKLIQVGTVSMIMVSCVHDLFHNPRMHRQILIGAIKHYNDKGHSKGRRALGFFVL